MDKTVKSGERTLLLSVLLSAPGPLVVGLGLFVGRSSTQLADFLRRSAELLAIIVSYFIYKRLNKADRETIEIDKARLEKVANNFVGFAMLFSGMIMMLVAVFASATEKGNVIPGLTIAFLGLVTNSWFWLRYARLSRANGDSILLVQSKLYRSKSVVDACVFIVLLIVMLFPLSQAASVADLVGSVIVSIYLIVNGLSVLKKQKNLVSA